MKIVNHIPFELIFWIGALVLLATAEVHTRGETPHLTLCPLANLGFSWCPGCGLGRAITHLFHGNLSESFAQHWFGLPALLIIGNRIRVLIRMNVLNYKALSLKYKEERYV